MENGFKTALAEGRVQLGIWCSLVTPVVAEILAQSAFDFVVFDGEHSAIEIAQIQPLLQAAGNGSAAPMVRPAWNDPVMIKRVLDLGAPTILLPLVQTAEEARAAVAATRYPAEGIRGSAGVTRAARYGRDRGYLAGANAQICTLVQVETAEALDRLPEIAGVEGVDGVFIGPSDLSASMGHLGVPGAPEVQEAIRAAAGTIRAAGKAPGILAGNAADARRYLDWGYQWVACSLDVKILVEGVDALHAAVAGA